MRPFISIYRMREAIEETVRVDAENQKPSSCD